MTLNPAIMVLFCGESSASWPRTASNHGAVGSCRRGAFARPHSTPCMEGDEVARSITALSRLHPLAGGCLAEVCGSVPALSRFPCCYCRPVTKLTVTSAASRACGPLIRHPSARDFGVTGSGGLSRGQRPGRRHRDPSRPQPAQLLPALPGRVAPLHGSMTNSQATTCSRRCRVRATAGD